MRFCVLLLLTCVSCTARAGDTPKPATRAKHYDLVTTVSPKPVVAHQSATYQIAITPKGEYHLKTDTPFKVVLEPGQGVLLQKSTFSAKDFVDPKATTKMVRTTFTAPTGMREIDARLTFFLCTAELCQRFKDEAKLQFPVR